MRVCNCPLVVVAVDISAKTNDVGTTSGKELYIIDNVEARVNAKY